MLAVDAVGGHFIFIASVSKIHANDGAIASHMIQKGY
jgi:hypothetical protein